MNNLCVLPAVFAVLLTCLLSACGHSCPDPVSEDYAGIVSEIGEPQREQLLLLHDSTHLHEYQGGLYGSIWQGDTVRIVESVWENGDARFIAWHIYGQPKIIDRLCIPPDVQY